MRVLLVSANTERIKMTSLPLGLGMVALAAHPVPRDLDCAASLSKRTLTNLYNQRPAWLTLTHKKLDKTVLPLTAGTPVWAMRSPHGKPSTAPIVLGLGISLSSRAMTGASVSAGAPGNKDHPDGGADRHAGGPPGAPGYEAEGQCLNAGKPRLALVVRGNDGRS